MGKRINLAQISPKFSALQQALIEAKSPEEKIEIMLTLIPKEERATKREELLKSLEELRKKNKNI
ncbi:MAG TPA: hypothetical protein PK674_01910 [Candidatus Absconditabacterales bacterium]|nr:hypothetical protein [Candidatus Absconditabacterales bacterium]